MSTDYRIEHVTEEAEWNQHAGSVLLQSWEWGLFQESIGRSVLRVIVRNGDHVVAIAQYIEVPAQMGLSYLSCPRGPVIFSEREVDAGHVMELLHEELRTVFPRALFVRFEPSVAVNSVAGIRQVRDMQPSATRILDLSMGEEALLADMKQKTRYNIRLAAKKGVQTEVVTMGDWAPIIDELYSLIEETSARHGIRPHARKYYAGMIEAFAQKGQCAIVRAWHENDVLVSYLLLEQGNTLTYLHGASSDVKKNLMAPYAAQWAAIQYGRSRGLTQYDFFGITPSNVEKPEQHYLNGVTRFKNGFGGEEVRYPGTFEQPLRPMWYTLYHNFYHVFQRARSLTR